MADLNLRDVQAELKAPFNMSDLEVRIGSKSKDKTKATVLVYTSTQAVEERLDAVVGPENWEVYYRTLDGGMICSLRVLGVTKESSFELAEGALSFTKAEASSFKRAASKFGIGRYLWSESKQVWAELNDSGFAFRDSKEKLVARVLSAPASQQSEEPAVARQERAPRPAAPAPATNKGGNGVSDGQRKALNAHKVPTALQDLITFKQAKGKTYGGEGLLDELAEAHDEKGKSWKEADALKVLARFGIGNGSSHEQDSDVEDLGDMEDEEM